MSCLWKSKKMFLTLTHIKGEMNLPWTGCVKRPVKLFSCLQHRPESSSAAKVVSLLLVNVLIRLPFNEPNKKAIVWPCTLWGKRQTDRGRTGKRESFPLIFFLCFVWAINGDVYLVIMEQQTNKTCCRDMFVLPVRCSGSVSRHQARGAGHQGDSSVLREAAAAA